MQPPVRRLGLLAGVAVVVLAVVAAGTVLDLPGADGDGLAELWVSDTVRDVEGNHHVAVGATVDGEPVVFAPISGTHQHDGAGHGEEGTAQDHDHSDCGLVALDGRTGDVRWRHTVPPANCTIHSVADPTVADVDGDGDAEVLAATTERVVTGFDAASGSPTFEHELSTYGYTSPVVADLTGDGDHEVVVVDVRGTVSVVRPGGEPVWTRELDGYVWGQPLVADFDGGARPDAGNGTGSGDVAPEVTVSLESGRVVQLAADGSVRWTVSTGSGSVTWSTAGRLDGEGPPDVVVATADGWVVALDGADGDELWRRDLGDFAAVHAIGDGDGDGAPEVYATGRDGFVRALSGADGSVEWASNVTSRPVQMMPPPVLDDLEGDGAPELVVAGNDGTVTVLAPADGTVLATYERDVRVYARPSLADLDGDPGREVLVIYGDGRVAALDYEG
jgi:outer membrane protein assembly factor BamB